MGPRRITHRVTLSENAEIDEALHARKHEAYALAWEGEPPLGAAAAIVRRWSVRQPAVGQLLRHIAHEAGLDLEPYPHLRAWLDRGASVPGHVPMDE
jgi:glutathione S-transferase